MAPRLNHSRGVLFQTPRNPRAIVPLIGFFEVLIWIVAVGSATRNLESAWAAALRGRGFGVTEFTGHGRGGAVGVVYTVLRRREIPRG